MKKSEKKQKGACLYALAGYGLVLYLFYFFISLFFNQARLHLCGEKTKAVIIKTYDYKASPGACYEFEVDGIKYEGYRGRFPKEIQRGDSVYITYLPSNPEINMRLGNED